MSLVFRSDGDDGCPQQASSHNVGTRGPTGDISKSCRGGGRRGTEGQGFVGEQKNEEHMRQNNSRKNQYSYSHY